MVKKNFNTLKKLEKRWSLKEKMNKRRDTNGQYSYKIMLNCTRNQEMQIKTMTWLFQLTDLQNQKYWKNKNKVA